MNEAQTNEKSKGHLFCACCSKAVVNCLYFGRNSEAREEWEKVFLRVGCWPGEGRGHITRRRMYYACDWLAAHIQLSLVGSKLEVGTKIREAVHYSPGILG